MAPSTYAGNIRPTRTASRCSRRPTADRRADSPLVYRPASGERFEYLDVLELGRIGRQGVCLENDQIRLLPDRDRALSVFLEVLIGPQG